MTGQANPATGTTLSQRLTRGDVLTAAQVAAILTVSQGTVYTLADRGEIPGARRLGRRWVFSHTRLKEWIEQ